MDPVFLAQLAQAIARYSRRKILLPNRRRAAVLVPLLLVDRMPSVLFTIRTGNVGTHKHDVSFPGGHIEKDETEREAAVRECREEVGLHARVLGEHNDVVAKTGTLVTPVVGVCDGAFASKDFASVSTSAEVASVFTLSLEQLLNPANVSLEHHTPVPQRPGITMPVYSGGPQKVWGLTAVVLAGILADVVRPAWLATGLPLLPGASSKMEVASSAPYQRDSNKGVSPGTTAPL
jgi:nudix motif 8